MWCCTNERCRTWLSIRSGSFEGSNIPLSTWLHMMFLWAMQISGSKISRLTSLSKPTVTQALSELRSIYSNKILNAEIKLGGLRKTVEIDESKFGAKRKCKRGRVSVFGLWSEDHRKCWSSVFPTELERHLCIVLPLHTSFLELPSTLINSLRT